MQLTKKQQDLVVDIADAATHGIPKIEKLNDGTYQLTVTGFPGQNEDERDENRVALQEEIANALGAGYRANYTESLQRMDGGYDERLVIEARPVRTYVRYRIDASRDLGSDRLHEASEAVEIEWHDTEEEAVAYVDKKEAVLGSVVLNQNGLYVAFVGQAFCGPGDYITEEAAKRCVEEKLR